MGKDDQHTYLAEIICVGQDLAGLLDDGDPIQGIVVYPLPGQQAKHKVWTIIDAVSSVLFCFVVDKLSTAASVDQLIHLTDSG